MHSFGYRANALITLGVTVLALMCAMASLSDNLNSPTPSAQVQVSLSLSLSLSNNLNSILFLFQNLGNLFVWSYVFVCPVILGTQC